MRKAASSWLPPWVFRQNSHSGWKARAIKPSEGCHVFLEGSSKSQERRETERGQQTSEIEKALLSCPQKKMTYVRGRAAQGLISGGRRPGEPSF